MHTFIWITTAVLLALWSAFAWGLHSLMTLDPAWVGELKPLIDAIPFGAVIDAWVPGWREMLSMAVDLSQVGLGWAGSAAPWLVGALWAAGAATLVLVGGLFSLLVVLLSRDSSAAPAMKTPGAT